LTHDEARKVTELLNAIVGEAGQLLSRATLDGTSRTNLQVAVRDTTRLVQHHVGQLRQVLDLTALIERDLATARLLKNLQTVIPDGSPAAIRLKLGRAELRKRGMTLLEGELSPSRTPHAVEDSGTHAARTEQHSYTTILLVEDDDQLRAMLSRMLSKGGYLVLQAGSGSEAIRVATRHKGPIALLLTDVAMPDLDGFGLRRRFRALRAETPVLYISGHAAESATMQDELRTSREPCLLKPFTETELNERIEAILDHPPLTH